MSSTTVLPGRRATAVLLVLAPLLELAESALSPLADGSTRSELDRIAAHQTAFAVSVVLGLVATVLFVPMFLGLSQTCVVRAPRAARIGGWVAAASMAGFAGVRGVQAVQLQSVRDGLGRDDAAGLLDHALGNPIGAVLLVLFLGGTVVGLVATAVATWRAGLPRPAVALLIAFPLVDNGTGGHAGTVLAHVVLLVALSWFAVALWRPERASARVTADHATAAEAARPGLPQAT